MLSLDSCAGVILAGGQSRRMGRCKALLPLRDGTMLEHITRQMKVFPERWLSANDPALGAGFPGRIVGDVFPGRGPLAGLHAALLASSKPYVFCITCDMPRFCRELIMAMLAAFPEGADALICVDGTGRAHPLCGIYARTVLPVLERHLTEGKLQVMALLEELRCAYLHTAGQFPDTIFLNINTPEAFCALPEKGVPND